MKKGSALIAAMALVLTLASLPARAGLLSAVYAFGDSLSDTGNSGLMVNRPEGPPAALGYVDGRSTNGPVAAEVLASGLGVPLRSYAVGGAMTGIGNADIADTSLPEYQTGMLMQISQYLTDAGGVADPQGLYLVFGGANDFLHLLEVNPLADETDFGNTATEVITNLAGAVITLFDAGARNFLLPLLPDFGAAPAVNDATISAAIQAANAMLALAYQDLLGTLAGLDPSVRFTIFDTLASQQAMTSSFAVPASACVDVSNTSVCSSPTDYFFWDDLHPTADVHARIGAEFLTAVPEPSTVALQGLAGLALLGLRRRRQASVRLAAA